MPGKRSAKPDAGAIAETVRAALNLRFDRLLEARSELVALGLKGASDALQPEIDATTEALAVLFPDGEPTRLQLRRA